MFNSQGESRVNLLTARLMTPEDERVVQKVIAASFMWSGVEPVVRVRVAGDQTVVAFRGANQFEACVSVNVAQTQEQLDAQLGRDVEPFNYRYPVLTMKRVCVLPGSTAFSTLHFLLLKLACELRVDGQPIASFMIDEQESDFRSFLRSGGSVVMNDDGKVVLRIRNARFQKAIAAFQLENTRGRFSSGQWEGTLPFGQYLPMEGSSIR